MFTLSVIEFSSEKKCFCTSGKKKIKNQIFIAYLFTFHWIEPFDCAELTLDGGEWGKGQAADTVEQVRRVFDDNLGIIFVICP